MSDLGRTPRRFLVRIAARDGSICADKTCEGEDRWVREDRVYEEDIEKAAKAVALKVFGGDLANRAPHEQLDCAVAARAACEAVLGGSNDNE